MTEQTLIPTDAAEVERVCHFGEDSDACRRVREQHRAWNAQLAKNKAEGDRLRAARERKDAAEAQARADARETERQARADAMKARLRTRFFLANPTASTDDYARLEQQLLDAELMHRATERRDADVEGLRQSGNYGPMG